MSRKDKILNGNALYTFIAIIIGFLLQEPCSWQLPGSTRELLTENF